MSSFTRGWIRQKTRTGIIHRPVVDLLFREKRGYNLYAFLVDSGADISLAPRQLAQRMGLDWEGGERVKLSGISPKRGCSVEGRVHSVRAVVPDLGLELKMSLCFADGDVPYLVGREGFFDYFRVSFDKKNSKTLFTMID